MRGDKITSVIQLAHQNGKSSEDVGQQRQIETTMANQAVPTQRFVCDEVLKTHVSYRIGYTYASLLPSLTTGFWLLWIRINKILQWHSEVQ